MLTLNILDTVDSRPVSMHENNLSFHDTSNVVCHSLRQYHQPNIKVVTIPRFNFFLLPNPIQLVHFNKLSIMKSVTFIAGLASIVNVATATVAGFDISNYQPNVDFKKAYADGARFVIIKVRTVQSTKRRRAIL